LSCPKAIHLDHVRSHPVTDHGFKRVRDQAELSQLLVDIGALPTSQIQFPTCPYSSHKGSFVNHPDSVLIQIRHGLGNTENNSNILSAKWPHISQWNEGKSLKENTAWKEHLQLTAIPKIQIYGAHSSSPY
jgi:hypothetical protein